MLKTTAFDGGFNILFDIYFMYCEAAGRGTTLTATSIEDSGPALEDRTCLASSCDGGCSVLMLGSHRSLP
ncbi:hypothetical protein AV530_014508 [Patagioenas fasciata monilis]|uniref:Uncharacterized protein n=1 Tax=Patagioenas fasciata monilis TaxID=372326 RepID=A0A1V4KCC4_PATFA|nr:hypothetical protein AV530_014508 [Patagioenas fasciata monilis]